MTGSAVTIPSIRIVDWTDRSPAGRVNGVLYNYAPQQADGRGVNTQLRHKTSGLGFVSFPLSFLASPLDHDYASALSLGRYLEVYSL